mmetsp:Transcript_69427/g.85146  ORF Transcript_69427/g.85146 Transcript_69427/m.85146 type:complete len:381 (+) Transcript_69427:52-1194(+)
MAEAVGNSEEKVSNEVQGIIDKCNNELKNVVKQKMKETFSDYNDEKISEYTSNLLEWDLKFDNKNIDPGRIINGWIEVILNIKKIKKELKKKEANEQKRKELLNKRLKKEFSNQFKKEFANDKLKDDDINEITNEVYKWHNDVLGKDVNKFVKAWVEVESKLQPIRDKYFKLQEQQEDREYEIERRRAEEEAARKREEDRIRREQEREERRKQREIERIQEQERKRKEEEERKKREEYERKPKFYKSPTKLKGKVSIKDAAKLTEYLKKTKGTQFIIMYEAKDGKKLLEHIRPEYIDKWGTKYHFILCKMDNDLTKAAKVWFNAWDLYTINQYPCFGIFLSGRSTLQEHIFFTNFEDGKQKLKALFDDCVHLKYDKKICG